MGDLFPVLALARAIEARGQPAHLLLGPDGAEITRSHGIAATPFGPSADEISRRLGLSRSEIAASVFRDPSILRKAIYPALAGLTRTFVPHVREARAVCGTALALAGPLAAEIAGRPYLPLLLNPRSCHRLWTRHA